MPWARIVRERADEYGWTPRQTLDEITVGQHLVIWFNGATRKPMTADRQREIINRNRIKQGLPPVKPRTRGA